MARITCIGTLLLAALGLQGAPLFLTGVGTYGGDGAGNIGSSFWNTACTPNVAQLAITGHSTCQLSVNITVPGTYIFDYVPLSGSLDIQQDPYLNLELFFNGEWFMPGIHAILRLDTPGFSVPGSNAQQCLYFNNAAACAPPPSGASSDTFTVGSQTVKLLGFTADQNRWFGQITIQVTDPNYVEEIPEPGSLVLVTCGALALLPRLRRRLAAKQ